MDWHDRIVIDWDIHHADPCIKGTRIPVSVIVASLADGDTFDQVIDAYPQITAVDIRAALEFAAEAVSTCDLVQLHRDGEQ
ncbi:MAG TPA: DUF433 domain-containing protein [Candidatus Binataceae bacterium]|jgi:uncharacterized protein (DUF433 family)|nr:DUF433 domain-containing protein [Candidatus Binataceae bacterium]